jgi:hypothetical protein
MAGNYVREGYLTSETVENISETVTAETLYFRMLLAADDSGRMPGQAGLISSLCWPLRPRDTKEIEKHLGALYNAGLITQWAVKGRSVLQITRWYQRGNSRRSKWPDAKGSYEIALTPISTTFGPRMMVTTSIPTDGEIEVAVPAEAKASGDRAFEMLAKARVIVLTWEQWRKLKMVYPDRSDSDYEEIARQIIAAAEAEAGGITVPYKFANAIFQRVTKGQEQKRKDAPHHITDEEIRRIAG